MFARLKANDGLGGEACQAFGLTANTLAALNVVVAFNRKRTRVAKLRRRRAKALTGKRPRKGGVDKPAASDRQSNNGTAGGNEALALTEPALRAPP